MIEAREGVFKALPLDLTDRAKFSYILDRIVEHESEWTDFQSDPEVRRKLASAYVAKALLGEAVIHEVWHLGTEHSLVGLLGFTQIVRRQDAQFHPVFFDGKLRNAFGKREILLRAMDWAFTEFDLHRISLQVPANRYAMVKFARQKLGFRFEAENRTIEVQKLIQTAAKPVRRNVALTPSARDAEYGSRKYQAVRQGNQWVDLLLLSILREEFATFARSVPCPISSASQTPSKPSPATSPD